MRTLMSQVVWVHYGQFYVESGEDYPDLAGCLGGQRNGLCGAAVPGILFLTTGTHTGQVGFTVELHDAPPPIDDSWQEIVEASFRPLGKAGLSGWGGHGYWPLRLAAADYRVRYSATGMDMDEEDPEVERYLLQFWPALAEPDRVVKQTSEIAVYWHEYAREQPPPPTPEEKAAAERRARAEREQAAEQARLEAEKEKWGGRLPSQRLRDLGGIALDMAQLDRSLIDALGETDPVTQRKVACWVTRRAFAEAQLADIDWIAAALDAMDRGEPLPWPFGGDDMRARGLVLVRRASSKYRSDLARWAGKQPSSAGHGIPGAVFRPRARPAARRPRCALERRDRFRPQPVSGALQRGPAGVSGTRLQVSDMTTGTPRACGRTVVASNLVRKGVSGQVQ